MLIDDLRRAPEASCTRVRPDIESHVSLIPSAAVKPIAVALEHAHHAVQPSWAAKVRVASKEHHQVTRHLLRGQLVASAVHAGIVVFDKLHIWQALEQVASFLGAARAVADNHGVVKVHCGVGVVRGNKFNRLIDMAVAAVLWKNISYGHAHVFALLRLFYC